MITLPDWTPEEQARHRAELLAAVPHGNKGKIRSRRPDARILPEAKPIASREEPHVRRAQGDTLEELLAAW